jgi:transcriptional regulator with XRE-family HTH domain
MNAIRELRKKKNWTIRELADISGVPYKVLWRMERGDDPKLKHAYKVANAFQLTVYKVWRIPPSGEGQGTTEAKTMSSRTERVSVVVTTIVAR